YPRPGRRVARENSSRANHKLHAASGVKTLGRQESRPSSAKTRKGSRPRIPSLKPRMGFQPSRDIGKMRCHVLTVQRVAAFSFAGLPDNELGELTWASKSTPTLSR